MKISADLYQYVSDNPHIEKVYFDRDGHHHFNVYSHKGKLYSRQRQEFEEAREDYEISVILTREQILEQELGEIISRKHSGQSVKQISYVIINNKKYIPMGNQIIQLPQAGQPAQAYPILDALVDATTLQPIPDAVATLLSRTVDNPAVAVIDSNGNLFPQAAGVVNVTSTNTWNYTDEDTQQPVTGKQETSTTPYTVISGPEQVVQTETLGAPVAAGTIPTAGSTAAAAKA